tara:strand:- start:86 stop:349 length:264 start_codon:yes stop_codon:yes gene_type:complete
METIDITPSWEACVKIYIAVLENENASFTGKREAREELLRLAKIVDNQNNQAKQKEENLHPDTQDNNRYNNADVDVDMLHNMYNQTI